MGEGSLGAHNHAHSYKDAAECDGYEIMMALKILIMMKVGPHHEGDISIPWGSHRHSHRNHCKTVSVEC